MEAEKYLVFSVDGHLFSLNFSDVKIIIPSSEPERIPDFPDYVLGTIKYDGGFLPVIDLRRRFGYAPKELTDRDCFIVTAQTEKQVGMLVDSISGFVEITTDKIQPAVQLNQDAAARFLEGEFAYDEKTECRIINPDNVIRLGDEKIFENPENNNE